MNDLIGAGAQDSPGENAARAIAGTDAAVRLEAGDKLVFDLNANQRLDAGDVTLLAVTKVQALVFLTDREGDNAFDADEVTGLAVSDGFGAKITTDLHGDLLTALDAEGNLSFAEGKLLIRTDSIHGVAMSGVIDGKIAAGGSISDLKIGRPLLGLLDVPSARELLAGTATGYNAFTFGATYLIPEQFVQPAGTAGGSISQVTLARSAGRIESGADGGSIFNLLIADNFQALALVAGDGGNAENGPGGAGGSVAGLLIDTPSVKLSGFA